MCTATRWQDYCGNANGKNYCFKEIGKKPKVGNLCTSIDKTKLFLSIFVEDINVVGAIKCIWNALKDQRQSTKSGQHPKQRHMWKKFHNIKQVTTLRKGVIIKL